MNFDWTKEVYIDWRSNLIKEEDVEHSVIRRLLSNVYCTPLTERVLTHQTPFWSPQDPFGTSCNRRFQNDINFKHIKFIPGQLPLPAYPQVSELTRQQHQQALKVVCAKHKNVQPKLYAKPNTQDYQVFEEIKEVYEAEQKKFLEWAKHLWINGGCIRALRPKPIIEQVYEAEFRMRAHNVRCWPQNYALAAQIPLETNKDSFELKHKGDLLNVNVQNLPITDYPEVMESNLSILLKSCPMPEPCREHICKFVLPYEDSVSSLPMSEIHRELAHFAISHDSSFVASENALQCLVETDRSWHIPVTVIEAIHPEHGDRRTVIVLGSEFGVQKECATQRTYRAYKHLLHHAFVPSMGQYKMKAPDKQPSPLKNNTEIFSDTKEPIDQRTNSFISLDDDLDVNSDEDDGDKLLIDDNESKNFEGNSEIRREPNRLLINDNEPNDEHEQLDSSEPNRLIHESNDSDPEGNEFFDDLHEPDDELSSEADRLIIADSIATNVEPICNYEAYEPNFTNDFSEGRPSYSHSVNDDDIQKAKLSVCKNLYSRMESENTNHDASKLLESKPKELNQVTFDRQSNDDDLSDDAIKSIKIDVLKNIYSRMAKEADKVNPKLIKSKVIPESKEINQNEQRSTSNMTVNLETYNEDLTRNSFESKIKVSCKPIITNTNNKTSITPTKLTAVTNPSSFERTDSVACSDNTVNTSEANKQINEVMPKILSPIKPCPVSVKSLSISETKAYNLTGCINLNTVSPIKNQASSERNDSKINNDDSEDQLIPRKVIKARVSRVKSPVKPIERKAEEIVGVANDSHLEKDLEELDTGPSTTKRSRLVIDHDYRLKPEKSHNKNISSAKGNPEKLNLCELFGDESDSDETNYNTRSNAKGDNNTQASCNQEILSSTEHKSTEVVESDKTDNRISNFSDPIDVLDSTESPVNTKRKLSCSDPSSTEPELNTSISGSESDEAILGFQNGSPVPITRSQKKSQLQPKISCTYSLRSRKTNRTNTKKSKLSHNKTNSFTQKASSESNTIVTRRRQISHSSNDSNGSKKVNKQAKTENVSPSQRFSARSNLEGNDSHKDKTNKLQEKSSTGKFGSVSENVQLKCNTKKKKTIKVCRSKRASLRILNNVSERTKRALRRTMNLESSDDDNLSDNAETDNPKPTHEVIQTKLATNNSTRSTKNSDASDFSDSDEDETVNIFHFTTNQTDSEDSDTESYLTIDDSQSEKSCTVTKENTVENQAKYYPDKINESDKTRTEKDYAVVDKSATVQTSANKTQQSIPSQTKSSSTVVDKTNTVTVTSMTDTENSKTTQIGTDSTVANINTSEPVTSVKKSKTSQIENDSTVAGTSAFSPITSTSQIESNTARSYSIVGNRSVVTSQPKVGTKQNESKQILHKAHIRTDESNRRSMDIPIRNEISNSKENTLPLETIYDIIGVNRCTCKGTLFAVPPPRSFKKWQVKNKTSNIAHDVIVHSAHKARQGKTEVILEPIVEYQPELGATRQSAGKIRALTLSLMLRESPRLINVRVNHENGGVLVIDSITRPQFIERHGDKTSDVADRLHTALDQLRFLVPGQYILAHDPSHGPNAMLYSTKGDCVGCNSLQLRRDNINMPDAEDALHVKTAPDLAPIPLPFHKYRGILPLAFTPNQNHVSTNKKITAALAKRAKLPPHGIQWPKKKKRARKPRQNRQPEANSTPSQN